MGIYRTYRRLHYLRTLAGSRRRAVLVYLRDLLYFRSLSPTGHRYRRLLTAVSVYSIVRGFVGRTPEHVSVERLAPGQSVTIAALRRPARRARRAR
jgi:hypothetical protein